MSAPLSVHLFAEMIKLIEMRLIIMHELGVLRHVVKTAAQVAKDNQIEKVKFITLEVGEESSYVPYYLNKLFPIAIEYYPEIGKPELKLIRVPGRRLQIKELGY